MTIRNRELSQFGSFIYVDNSTQEIGIATGVLPYVGIGTTNPQYKLDVVGDVRIDGDLYYNGELSFGNVDLNTTGIITASGFYNSLGQQLTAFDSWGSSGSNIYRLSGNVGIGTSVISEKLEIIGNAKAARFISTVTTGTAPFSVNSTTEVANLNASLLRGGVPGQNTNSNDIVTLGASQTLTNKTLTSPVISTIVNTGTLTLPTTTGTLICSGDTGTVTSTMIADLNVTNSDIATNAAIAYSKLNLGGSVTNSDIASGAAIAITKLAASTISGISLGNNLNSLTAGTYVSYDSGSTYNGNTARTISVKASSSNADPTNFPIVARNSSGDFSAGTITAFKFIGDGSGLTGVGGGSSITVKNDTSTDATYYVGYSTVTSGITSSFGISTGKLTFNPSTGNLSATLFTSLSDASKKTNIRPLESPIQLTQQLQGVRFNWIDNNRESIGVIAQEVEKVLPELVETSEDGTKSVNYGNIVAVLIEAIKEQQIRIEELERKVNAQ